MNVGTGVRVIFPHYTFPPRGNVTTVKFPETIAPSNIIRTLRVAIPVFLSTSYAAVSKRNPIFLSAYLVTKGG